MPVEGVRSDMIQAFKPEARIIRHKLTDFEWAAIRPFLPNKPRGIPRVDDRRVLNGIFWVLRSCAPWRDLPETYGPRTTCYNRFVRWRQAGVWDRIMDALAAGHDAAKLMTNDSARCGRLATGQRYESGSFGSRRAHSIMSSERTNEVGRLPIDYRSRSLRFAASIAVTVRICRELLVAICQSCRPASSAGQGRSRRHWESCNVSDVRQGHSAKAKLVR